MVKVKIKFKPSLVLFLIVILIKLSAILCINILTSPQIIKSWAIEIGGSLQSLVNKGSCLEPIAKQFNNMNPRAVYFDGHRDRLAKMITDVQNMFNWKKGMVKSLSDEAQSAAANHPFESQIKVPYVNAKKLYSSLDEDEAELYKSKPKWSGLHLSKGYNFRNVPVNFETSAVHIPVNVYEEKSDIRNALLWSDKLDVQFRNNRGHDSSVNWQFFCSSTGFLRFYPAAKWRLPEFLLESNPDQPSLDLYDCRLRNWYVKAVASPKDVVILLDGSGSMTGHRKEIAKKVVSSILDTLSDDDYATVIRFSNELEPAVKCFGDKLVEANSHNVAQFKESLDELNTTEIADFTSALIKAFEVLQHANRSSLGSLCNQAIMLVTDGAPNTYKQIFEKYNYPRINIRVFTYLVGKEVTETKEVNLIACENRGYYTHVSSLAEVREKVHLYLPVMSRPLVLSGNRDFTFTPVYADITDVPLTPWVWEEREREKIRRSLMNRIRIESEEADDDIDDNGDEEDEDNIDAEIIQDHEEIQNQYPNESMGVSFLQSYNLISTNVEDSGDPKMVPIDEEKTNNKDYLVADVPQEKKPKKKGVHELMITLSLPVFDTKNATNLTERFLVKNVWRERVKEVRSANLLGVAGIDIPIREIVNFIPAYKLGVNGYSFLINNNGFVLYHSDLRPLFQDLLKPFYTAVDLLELELPDRKVDKNPRDFDSDLYELKKNMIKQNTGWKSPVPVKVHHDSMKRVVNRTHSYYYGPISGTPFSLGIVFPKPYGHFEINGQIEVKRKEENYSHYFRDNNWRVHPDWVYCRHIMEDITIQTPEDSIKLFLKMLNEDVDKVQWMSTSMTPFKHVSDKLKCEKDLVQSLIFDAKATLEPTECRQGLESEFPKQSILTIFDVKVSFVATRSGLTRFNDFRNETDKNSSSETFFMDTHNRAIDEIFYQRAVDYYLFNSSASVFSVPFDAGEKPGPIYVTGSKALFVDNDLAPIAVFGVQFNHSKFKKEIFNFHSILCNNFKCDLSCNSDDLSCYLIDNNGFILLSETLSDTGKFFGEIDAQLFEELIKRNIFKAVKMYDYQAICIDIIQPSGPASSLTNPFLWLVNNLISIWTKLTLLIIDIYIQHIDQLVRGEYYSHDESDYENSQDYPNPISHYADDDKGRRLPPNKTRPYPCDKQFHLYKMEKITDDPIQGSYHKCKECEESYIITTIPYTNLLVLIKDEKCRDDCQPHKLRINPTEILYYNCQSEKRHVDKLRRRPKNCTNFHPGEREIKQCGTGVNLKPIAPAYQLIIIINLLHLICIRHLLYNNK